MAVFFYGVGCVAALGRATPALEIPGLPHAPRGGALFALPEQGAPKARRAPPGRPTPPGSVAARLREAPTALGGGNQPNASHPRRRGPKNFAILKTPAVTRPHSSGKNNALQYFPGRATPPHLTSLGER